MSTENAIKRVLVSDKMSQKGVDWMKAQEGIEVVVQPGMSVDELKAAVKDVDAIVIRSATKVRAEILQASSRIKVVGRAGIGVDNVDVEEASKRGVLVMNEPAGNNITTAEHAISLLLSMTRMIPQAAASMKAGKWEKSKFMGTEVTGMTLGIIGLGNIGKYVAERGTGLKMRVIAHDPFVTEEAAAAVGAELVEFTDLLALSDFITIHTPLLPQTRGLVDDEAFGAMKDGVLLVNAARGGIVDEAALIRALDSGKVARAACDVFVKEPPASDDPLVLHPNVIATPHLGASTHQAQDRVALQLCRQVVNFLKTGAIENAINLPRVNPEAQAVLQSYTLLGERVGQLLGGISTGTGSIEISLRGKAFQHGQGFVSNAIICGLLSANTKEKLNLVNALVSASEQGWKHTTLCEDAKGQFSSEVSVTVTTDAGVRRATGVVFGDEPRLVELDGARLDALLEGTLFVMENKDQPGVVGAVGTALSNEGINVDRIHLAKTQGDKALSIWSVNRLSDATINNLLSLQHVDQIHSITLP